MSHSAQQLRVLEALLIQLQGQNGQLATSIKQSAKIVELDQTSVGRLSRMDAMQGQAMAKASQARQQVELKGIKLALEKLKSGNLGRCDECDGLIAFARLEIDPTVELCIDCARLQEH